MVAVRLYIIVMMYVNSISSEVEYYAMWGDIGLANGGVYIFYAVTP